MKRKPLPNKETLARRVALRRTGAYVFKARADRGGVRFVCHLRVL